METSQALSKAGSAGWPKWGAAAASKNRSGLSIDVLHTVIGVQLPALDDVALIELRHGVGRLPLLAIGLDIARFVGGAALQHHRFAVPFPGQAEAGQAFGQDGSRHFRFDPSRALVHGNFHFGDLAMARPGKAGDLVIAGAVHGHAAGRPGDDGFDRLDEIELAGFAVLSDWVYLEVSSLVMVGPSVTLIRCSHLMLRLPS